jgi:hypothetical protein
MSIPFFVQSDRGAKVGSLEQFVESGVPARYSGMFALDYHAKRVGHAYSVFLEG